MEQQPEETESTSVALLAEGVDRNQKEMRGTAYQDTVALLAEGVDRNNKHKIDK